MFKGVASEPPSQIVYSTKTFIFIASGEHVKDGGGENMDFCAKTLDKLIISKKLSNGE